MNINDFSPFSVPTPEFEFVDKPLFMEGESQVWTLAELKSQLIGIVNYYLSCSRAMETGPWYEQRQAYGAREANLADFLKKYKHIADSDLFRTLLLVRYGLDLCSTAINKVTADLVKECGVKSIADAEILTLGQIVDAFGKTNKGAKSSSGTDAQIPIDIMRNQVFISYSHKDSTFLTQLIAHLKPYVRSELITHWTDKDIQPGSDWFLNIQMALAKSSVAVALVSPSFLASDFISEHELKPILSEVDKGTMQVIWIPIRACSYGHTALKDLQAVCDPNKPLARMKAERDNAWVMICKEIQKALAR